MDAGIVHAQHRQPIEWEMMEKFDEGFLKLTVIAAIGLHMVFINVSDDGDHGLEMQEGRIALIRLGD